MRPSALPTVGALSVALLLAPSAAATAATKKPSHVEYRIASVTHRSTASAANSFANAHASSSWKLAKATRKAPNRLGVDYTRVGVTGGGMMNLRGTYRADATNNQGTAGHCELVAPTGSKEFGMAAPGPDMLAVAGGKRGLTVTFGTLGGGSRIASAPSGAGYFGSECTTSWHDGSTKEIEGSRTLEVPFSTFRRKSITLRFRGGYSTVDTTAKWDTKIVLRQVKAKKKAKAKR